jgi:hypothetical protein
MSTQSDIQKDGDALPGLIECLARLAADSGASIRNRLDAVALLLRFAIGPRSRPADGVAAAAIGKARIALADAAAFLDQTMASNNHRARIRLHAASLASLAAKVSGSYK